MNDGANKSAGPLVLVADDDPVIRAVAVESLEQNGFAVHEAETGVQAFEAFRRLRPDIVLLDVMMPEMDGFAVCTQIRQQRGGERTPVLMVTGLNDDESINRAYDVGATDFIAKPINPIILVQRVRYMLRASQVLRELAATRDAALEAVRLKSEFLATMSHEIRTPMNGVIGMTGLLANTELTDEQRDYVATIRHSGESLLGIINEILDLSRIEAGKLKLEAIDFDLRAAVDDVMELLAERAGVKGLELTCLVRFDVPNEVRGDPGRLRQILTNLVGNAIKFTEHGEVAVRVSLVKEDGAYATIRFEVTDTGIGVTPEARASLFQSFSQADGSHSRKYGGTGLGLAIAKQLTEHMGGTIDAESEPGKGSTFVFTARLERRPAAATLQGEGTNPRLQGVRALIVDDHATTRTILAQEAAALGMSVDCAADGPQGLELMRRAAAAQRPYELAVLDQQMPGMTGLQVAQAIKQDEQLRAARLVLLVTVGHRGDAEAARQAGVSAYFMKPVRFSHMREGFAAVLGAPSPDPDADNVGPGPDRAVALVTRHSLRESRSREQPLVLVVDDNDINQQVAIRILQRLGCQADVAASGREAIEALARRSYALVLMDCQMPDMDGIQATAEIRRREREGNIGLRTTIVAVTANAMKGDRERYLAAGMDDYVAKPLTIRVLGAALERWISSKAA
jgi:CheY-like chemotaxis protein